MAKFRFKLKNSLKKFAVPQKFEVKKEIYAHDPNKLLQTYQEEWERFERISLSRRKDHRKPRNLSTPGSSSSRSSSNEGIRFSDSFNTNLSRNWKY